MKATYQDTSGKIQNVFYDSTAVDVTFTIIMKDRPDSDFYISKASLNHDGLWVTLSDNGMSFFTFRKQVNESIKIHIEDMDYRDNKKVREGKYRVQLAMLTEEYSG